jgi:regulator of extracellular matrix RemA (YlzA/DUF370 family)
VYLHIGENYMINKKDIVMIGNYESAISSEICKEFFSMAEEEGFILDYSKGKARSFILTDEKIYLSLISSNTLGKRMKAKDGGLQYAGK